MTPERVDRLITSVAGKWRFDEEVARHFDGHVRRSIPGYVELQDLVADISAAYARDGGAIYDIGCSTGETLHRLQQRHAGRPGLRLVGIESSRPMVEQARHKCGDGRVELVHGDAAEIEAFPEACLVLSLYTLHFVPREKRLPLLQRIRAGLAGGGALVLAEKLRAENPAMQELWDRRLREFKLGQGLTEEMIRAKARSLEGVLVPLTLAENLELLRRAGFARTDVFFQWNCFAGILAVHPADRPGREDA